MPPPLRPHPTFFAGPLPGTISFLCPKAGGGVMVVTIDADRRDLVGAHAWSEYRGRILTHMRDERRQMHRIPLPRAVMLGRVRMDDGQFRYRQINPTLGDYRRSNLQLDRIPKVAVAELPTHIWHDCNDAIKTRMEDCAITQSFGRSPLDL